MNISGLMLLPGAGADRTNRTLVALEERLAPLPVRRVDFPGRAAGKRGVEKASTAVAHVVSQAEDFAAELGVPLNQIAVGGRSFGGRMCSMAVADGLEIGALVLLSYPLHPPGKPENLRIEHLPAITVPTLAVSGEKDPFGAPDELRTHLGAIVGHVTLEFVTGHHSPADAGVVAAVQTWLKRN